uniref:Protein-serine/threonine kinase n=1 Tax=Pyramimonas obovata TaxID=1411642 RepID=A0A7S0WQJ0_9CHLO|mmetsp:Transcript_35115/g.76744  ORF Transcript_35115/g.76744 Transcript_35115/m.76744 type:complete len:425 (+) Transcript_35115:253-1527(+)
MQRHLARAFGVGARRGLCTNSRGMVEVPQERLSQLIRAEAMTMASRETRGYSVNDMLELWDTPNINALKISARFIYHELPIRYAVRTKELENAPSWIKTKDFMEVFELYAKSFEDLRMLPEPYDMEGLERFAELLEMIKLRNAGVVPKLGSVVAEVRDKGLLESPRHTAYVNQYLNQFFSSRIGSELLVSQHLALHKAVQQPDSNFARDKTRAGMLKKNCKPAEIIKDAVDHATRLCDRQFGKAPEIVLRGDLEATFPYFPDQLYYISFELLKNAMRATSEYHAERPSLPPVQIVISHSDDTQDAKFKNLGIQIQDEGGGIQLEQIHKVWQYSFTTVKKETIGQKEKDGGTGLYMVNETDKRADPLAGLGFGLPLSRLYAQAFGGTLKLTTLEGWGSTAYLHLNRSGNGKVIEHTGNLEFSTRG